MSVNVIPHILGSKLLLFGVLGLSHVFFHVQTVVGARVVIGRFGGFSISALSLVERFGDFPYRSSHWSRDSSARYAESNSNMITKYARQGCPTLIRNTKVISLYCDIVSDEKMRVF